MSKAAWIVVPAAVAVCAGVVSGTAASAHFGCTVRSAPPFTNPAAVRAFAHACFPKKISGSFSGTGMCMTWEGTVSLPGRALQTTYSYRGRAKYQWKYKAAPNPCLPEAGCTASPDHGTINEPVGLEMNIGSDKRGWSYDGGNGGGGGTVPIITTCGGEPSSPFPEKIEGAFAPEGFTKDLRTFAGSVKSGKNVFKWSFHGTR